MERRKRLKAIMWLSAATGTGGALFAILELLSRGKVDTIVTAAFLLAVAGCFMAVVNYRKIKREER